MDQKTTDSVLTSIQNLKKDQKVVANKVIKLTEAFQNTIKKMEKKINEKFELYDERFKKVEEPFKDLKKVVNKHSDDVVKLEEEYQYTVKLINLIDKNLSEIETKIEVSEGLIEKLKHEENKHEENNHDEKEDCIKQCIFDRKGYCYQKENCDFFHTEEICTTHVENGICNKTICRKRHPRQCRYYSRGNCRRGESCKYLHGQGKPISQCNKCESSSTQTYYCEVCGKTFCSECTVKEAHALNIYEAYEAVDCSKIHN